MTKKSLRWAFYTGSAIFVYLLLPPLTHAISINGLTVINITTSSARVSWITDVPGNSIAYYGTAGPTYPSTNRCDGGGLTTSHCVDITGLYPSTLYFYQARSTASDNSYSTYPATFGTFITLDTGTPPTAPSGLIATSTTSGGSTYVYLSWTDNSTNEDRFDVYRSSNGGSATLIGSTIFGTVSMNDNPPTGSNSYYVVACTSGIGCSAQSNILTITIGSDSTPPSTPTGLSVFATSTSAVIGWAPSTDNVGVVGYKVFRNSIFLTTVTSGTYYDTSLTSGTNYTYYIKAIDAASNESAPSSLLSFTTPSATDTTPPTPPTSVIATASTNSIALNWSGASDNVGVTNYKIFKNNLYITSVTSASYVDYSVAPSISYVYNVKAVDAAGNESAMSAPAYATVSPVINTSTSSGSTSTQTIPSAPTNLAYSLSNGGSQVVLSWQNNATNANAVKIDRLIQGGTWANYAQVSPDTHSLADSSVTAGGYYYYKVFACNDAGCSANSNIIGVAIPTNTTATSTSSTTTTTTTTTTTATTTTTSTSSSLPYAPTLYAPTSSYGYVGLNWTFVPNATYKISRYPSQNNIWGILSQNITGTFYADQNVPVGIYAYKVNACNTYGCSIDSNIITVSVASYTTQNTTTTPTTTTQIGQNGTVSGKITDSSGNSVSGAYVHFFNSTSEANLYTTSDGNGYFSISLPTGNYSLDAYPPSSRTDLTRSAPITFTINSNDRKSFEIKFGTSVKIITGRVQYDGGASVTDAEVGAYSLDTRQWINTLSDANGSFSLNVSGGNWQVGIRPRDPASANWTYGATFPTVSFSDSGTETRVVNFTVSTLRSSLIVHTTDKDGKSVQGAGIVVSTVSEAGGATTNTSVPPLYGSTDENGNETFALTAGTYYVRAALPQTSGYINPKETTVSLGQAGSQTISLVFTKQEATSTILVKGTTKLASGVVTDAFIWAWSENGGTAQTRSGADGLFSFSATPGRWHIGAGKDTNGISYQSANITTDIFSAGTFIEIIMGATGETLPKTLAVTQTVTQQITAQVQDGTKVTIPTGAVSGSGNVNLEVKSTVEAPSGGGARVISTVYDVKMKNDAGASVTSFQKKVEITIPYTDTDLKAQGIGASNLIPSYYNEATGIWTKVDDYTIDTKNKIVILRVDHFTRFALIAAADITPPDAPSKLWVSNGAKGVSLAWQDPYSDFDHATVYRSTEPGNRGKALYNNVTSGTVDDTTTKAGTKYYYTVVAIDPAGNESSNNAEASIVATGGGVGSTVFSRILKVGSQGDDVKALQAILIKEKVYPEAIVSGYFGKLTKAAVIRFQEKYADEILKPYELTQGTGNVGLTTRAKLNQLSE